MSKQILVHVWYLEYTEGTSYKFYKTYIAENGITIVRWGRIGSIGQFKVNAFPSFDQAKDLGLRQVYEKKAKGYVEKYGDVIFETNNDMLAAAIDGNFYDLDDGFNQAVRGGDEFETAKTDVLRTYAEFSTRIQNLLDRAEHAEVDVLMDEYQGAETVWEEINDKHAEVTAAMNLCKTTLMRKLVG